jgi:hypothetical protein
VIGRILAQDCRRKCAEAPFDNELIGLNAQGQFHFVRNQRWSHHERGLIVVRTKKNGRPVPVAGAQRFRGLQWEYVVSEIRTGIESYSTSWNTRQWPRGLQHISRRFRSHAVRRRLYIRTTQLGGDRVTDGQRLIVTIRRTIHALKNGPVKQAGGARGDETCADVNTARGFAIDRYVQRICTKCEDVGTDPLHGGLLIEQTEIPRRRIPCLGVQCGESKKPEYIQTVVDGNGNDSGFGHHLTRVIVAPGFFLIAAAVNENQYRQQLPRLCIDWTVDVQKQAVLTARCRGIAESCIHQLDTFAARLSGVADTIPSRRRRRRLPPEIASWRNGVRYTKKLIYTAVCFAPDESALGADELCDGGKFVLGGQKSAAQCDSYEGKYTYLHKTSPGLVIHGNRLISGHPHHRSESVFAHAGYVAVR